MSADQKLIDRFIGTLRDDAFAEHPDVKAARADVEAAHARLAEAQAALRQRLAIADRAQAESEHLGRELLSQAASIDTAAVEDATAGDMDFPRACEANAEYQRIAWRQHAAERAATLIREQLTSERPTAHFEIAARQARQKLADVLTRLKAETARATPRETIVRTVHAL